jgi:hypothetical protein
MIRLMSHQGHSASDALVAGGLAVGARGARAKRRPPLGSPLGEQSRGNQDAIMIRLMSHQGHSASDALVAGGRRAWRASEAQAASRRPPR